MQLTVAFSNIGQTLLNQFLVLQYQNMIPLEHAKHQGFFVLPVGQKHLFDYKIIFVPLGLNVLGLMQLAGRAIITVITTYQLRTIY